MNRLAEDEQVYAAISDAFYDARNSGRTMTDAATYATEAVELIIADRIASERTRQADRLTNAAASLASMKHQPERVTAKREGVLLALSYIEEDQRMAAQVTR